LKGEQKFLLQVQAGKGGSSAKIGTKQRSNLTEFLGIMQLAHRLNKGHLKYTKKIKLPN
jgi:hypothetical protein